VEWRASDRRFSGFALHSWPKAVTMVLSLRFPYRPNVGTSPNPPDGTLTSDDPFGGETNGIPNGLGIPYSLAGLVMPGGTGCDFGSCGTAPGFIGCGNGGCPTFGTYIDYLQWLLLLSGPNVFIDQRITPRGMTPSVPPNSGSCSRYQDGTSAGVGLYLLCMKFPDGRWSDCVRGKLLNQYPPNPSPFQLVWYLGPDHAADFTTCKFDQPVE
jgi:hypothetical protein